MSTNHDTALRVMSRMWVAKCDVDEGNRTLAEQYVSQLYDVTACNDVMTRQSQPSTSRLLSLM